MLIHQIERTARKDHDCMACDWIKEGGWSGMGFTFSELRLIAIAKGDNWKIKKGMKYIRQAVDGDGHFYTFKARPEIHALCLKYDYYPEC